MIITPPGLSCATSSSGRAIGKRGNKGQKEAVEEEEGGQGGTKGDEKGSTGSGGSYMDGVIRRFLFVSLPTVALKDFH